LPRGRFQVVWQKRQLHAGTHRLGCRPVSIQTRVRKAVAAQAMAFSIVSPRNDRIYPSLRYQAMKIPGLPAGYQLVGDGSNRNRVTGVEQ
jgi:hypothetical protein